MKILYFIILFLCSFNLQSQPLQYLKAIVSKTDSINKYNDENFGEGDDGIYNIVEPTVISSSNFKEKGIVFKAQNIHDFNLKTAWIEGKKGYGIGEYIEFTFDLSTIQKKGENAFSINSFFIINGYRKSLKIWRENSRVKKLKMYIDNVPFAFVLLKDTYKFQFVHFKDFWIKYGAKKKIKFEIVEIFPGEKYKETALSEIEFSGKYSENMSHKTQSK